MGAEPKLPSPGRDAGNELDELTLARAQRGDPAAFRALVVRYQAAVFSFLWRMGGARASRAWVEDLAQDTFLRVFRGLGAFRADGSARLSTWILTIATRVALRDLSRRWWRILPLARRSLDIPDEARADSSAERRALGKALARAVARLPAEQRAVLLLRDYHELDYREIATALDTDLGTVKSRLSRARAALRRALQGERT